MTPGARDADALKRTAHRSPDVPAMEGPDRSLSYRELDREVERLAGALSRLADSGPEGRFPGRLALVLESRLDTALLLHAGFRAGLTVAPLSPSLTPTELSAAFSALDPLAVVCDDGTEAAVRSGGLRNRDPRNPAGRRRILSTTRAEALIESLNQGIGGESDAGERAARTSTTSGATDPEPGYVVWTSGSSGRARGVLLTQGSLGTVIDGSARRLELGPGDRWLTTLSLAHVGGLATVLRAVRTGATLVVRDSFDEAELLALALDGKVTHASLVPVMLRRILARAGGEPSPAPLRCLLVGGAHAPPELVEEAVELDYPVALTYGMTETSSQSATAAPEKVRRKSHVVGTPLPGVEMRIADDGEIRVRGSTLAAGYVTTGAVDPLDLDEEGWFRTGDLGRWDADGDLVVTGRLSSRIITGGVTVDPAEVEEALRSLPRVADAVVVGVPDPEWGERVSAALVLEPSGVESGRDSAGTDPGADASVLEEVDREMRRRLSGPKRPRNLRILRALPRTPSGKVDRARVRRLLGEKAGE